MENLQILTNYGRIIDCPIKNFEMIQYYPRVALLTVKANNRNMKLMIAKADMIELSLFYAICHPNVHKIDGHIQRDPVNLKAHPKKNKK